MSRESFPRAQPRTEEKPDMTRRQFLAAEAALGATGLIATGAVAKIAIEKSHEQEKPTITPEWWKSVGYAVPKDLQGESISPLELAYINPAPQKYESKQGEAEPPTWPLPPRDADHPDIPAFPLVYPPIDFAANLERMTDAKTSAAEVTDAPDIEAQRETFTARAQEYHEKWERNEVRRMNLHQFKKLIEIESVRAQVLVERGMPRLVEKYFAPLITEDERLSDEDKNKLLGQLGPYMSYLAEQITPDVLLSYIATELMPSTDRALPLLEFITKNAGIEYVERIPALGDSELSYGPFQLTRHVVGPENKELERETGSVTQLLKTIDAEHALPSSLAEFTSIEQHLQAGYLVAFQNILMAVRDTIREQKYDQLKMISQTASSEAKKADSTVFVEYVSSAHHRPSDARKALQNSLDDNKNMPTHLRNGSLEGYFPNSDGGREVEKYALKTRENYQNVLSRLG